MIPTRSDAERLVHDWTASESLRKHMLAVECAMRAYARYFHEDEDLWGITGLIHDFDYERFPNADQLSESEHPTEGVELLRRLGWPETICEAVLGHADYTNVPRVTRLARALFAVDELTGLITACALVKPGRAVSDVSVSGVRKKMKDKAFARGVNRDDIIQGAESLGVGLDEHIQRVLSAMQENAALLGLAGVGAGVGDPPAASTSTTPPGDA